MGRRRQRHIGSHGYELDGNSLVQIVDHTSGDLLVADLTGQYVGVFFAQILIAGLLAAWYVSIKKRVTASK